MRLTIHRGTREIGGNCVEIESQGTRLILDIGLPIFDANGEPHDTAVLRRKSKDELRAAGILVDVPGLFGGGSQPDAILLSHAHEDHTGLLRHSRREIPVFASRGTSKMMSAGSRFAGQPRLPAERYRELVPKVPVQIGNTTVTGFPVDHSIYGAMALLVEAEGKRLLYSGDLRMHGRKPGMMRDLLDSLSATPIDVLLMEGTHIGHPDLTGPNEYALEEEIVQTISKAPGLVLASFSPQHVDRLVAFLRAAKRTGRIFVADAYTAYVLYLIHTEIPVPDPRSGDWLKVYFPKFFEQAIVKKRLERLAEMLSPVRVGMEDVRRNPERFMMVFRPSMLESDFEGSLPDETTCISSRWTGYLDRPEWKSVEESLARSGGRLLTLHTSGHVYYSDVIAFMRALSPRLVIPIHTFNRDRFDVFPCAVEILSDGESMVIR